MNVTPLMIDTPIDWDAYQLTADDRARVIAPATLIEKATAILHGTAEFDGVPLPWAKAQTSVRLRRGKVSVWAGITHHGKTAMLKQVCLSLVKHGERVCIASLEEVPEETFADLLTLSLGIYCNENQRVQEIADWLHGKLWLYDQQGMVSADRMLALMTYAAKAKGCTHFVIDSLMRLGIQSDDYEAQRVFFNRITSHAKQLNLHVHVVCHMRKQSDESQLPTLMDVRGAAAIVEQADNVFVVWRDKRQDRGEFDPAGMLVVEKQRGRPNWIGRIALWREFHTGQFTGGVHEGSQWFLPNEAF